MSLLKKSALAFIPLVLVLAGCNTVNKTSMPATGATATQAPATQGAAVDVYAASNATANGFRPLRLNNQQTIYVSQRPVFSRSNVTGIDIVRDNQARTYVQLTLNPQGVALMNSVPANMGYATTVGGQLASLSGVRQGNRFLFNVRDQQTATAIVQAIVPQQAKR